MPGQKAISKHELLLFLCSPGLWAEHIFDSFSHGTQQEIFEFNFLKKMSDYTKNDHTALADQLFDLCRGKNAETIDRV